MSTSFADRALAGLKDFQRDTVDHTFERLYAPGASGRFLVADEVGLGKTLIARGVIGKAVDRLKSDPSLRPAHSKTIDVIYICCNADIARQNIDRLLVGDEHTSHTKLASRLTLLPKKIEELKSTPSGVNLISFTPATSFDLTGGLGRSDERVLLYHMLKRIWRFRASSGPLAVLQGAKKAETFESAVDDFDPKSVPDDAYVGFEAELAKQVDGTKGPSLRERFDELCKAFSRNSISVETSRARSRFVGELRIALAASCIAALDPQLIILDEFQRFSHILAEDDDDGTGQLARRLFTYEHVRVLLLSATPYKMYTTADEASGEDHYEDFVRTLRFLENGAGGDVQKTVGRYRESLFKLGEADASSFASAAKEMRSAQEELEGRLRAVMVRTERLASTEDRNGMLEDRSSAKLQVRTEDLAAYLNTQRVGRHLEAPDSMELWKSAPYLLSFVDDTYVLGRRLDDALDGSERREIARVLSQGATGATLPWDEVESYRPLEIGNARMRALIDDVIASGAWRLLWGPPSLPYYGLEGAYGETGVAKFTKRLVFSAWRMVPRAIASIISYEVERRMLAADPTARNTPEARKRRRGTLQFKIDDGRLAGMPVLALLYPSLYLAKACDPQVLLSERIKEHSDENGPSSVAAIALADVLALAKERIGLRLERLPASPTEGREDERWYWAAPLLLDRLLDEAATKAWFEQDDLADMWSGEVEEEGDEDDEDVDPNTSVLPPSLERDAWAQHVEQARQLALGTLEEPLGRRPHDLVDVLAELAVAGPAVAMFRALDRVVGGEKSASKDTRTVLRNGAARTAWAFRALFNRGSVTWMIRGPGGEGGPPYWRLVLKYCAEGCLPAVLDEYVHVLQDHLGLMDHELEDRVHKTTDELGEALGLRPSQVRIQDIRLSESGRTVRRESRNLVTQFAARFADQKTDEGADTRADQVRKAFNSPFWPFVLATTSVGQEGLDFHPYCHAVVHWNLPSNPVDLEQREGRVHRYKGHAVRRNVAHTHGWGALTDEERDVWLAIFQRARAEAEGRGQSEIVPFWVYPVDGGAKIERHVLALPLSREHAQGARLKNTLTVYRMVFGQPRQDDLVRYLLERVPKEQLDGLLATARIDLSPRTAGHRA